jgi:RNA recognition motif-containing protein
MNIFVGNLLFEATEADVRKAFEHFGTVATVTIVMDKKGKNSRGFGFVEMLVEQEAQEAILTLDGKEFMGRVLNVSQAYPKSESDKEKIERKKKEPKINIEIKDDAQKEAPRQKSRFKPAFLKKGGYKGGRRTRSYIMRQVAAGVEEPMKAKPKHQGNPMRWRKKPQQPKPWHKKQEENKSWQKKQEEPKPWQKKEGESKPWHKKQGESKPWHKKPGESKPWGKKKQFQSKGRKKGR